jgi:hypothetical protein
VSSTPGRRAPRYAPTFLSPRRRWLGRGTSTPASPGTHRPVTTGGRAAEPAPFGGRWRSIGTAVAAPVLAAALLIPVRDRLAPAHVALGLVVVVVAIAARGRRVDALVAPGAAALGVTVLHAEPSGSRWVASARDLVTMAVLLGIGVASGEVAHRARQATARAEQLRRDLAELQDVAGMVASGAPPALVVVEVNRALQSTLSLRGCRFDIGTWWLDEPPVPAPPRGAVGADSGGHRIELVARSAGIVVGRYVAEPGETAEVPRERRLAAEALADQAAAALVAVPAPDAATAPGRPIPTARPDGPYLAVVPEDLADDSDPTAQRRRSPLGRATPRHLPKPRRRPRIVRPRRHDRPSADGPSHDLPSDGGPGHKAAGWPRRRALLAVGAGFLGPALAALAVAPGRHALGGANAALVLVATVVAAAALGRRGVAMLAALSATAWFDLLHTRPYYSLTIRSRDDIVTAALLLVVGVAVAELVLRGGRDRAAGDGRAQHIGRIHALAEMVATGQDADFVVIAAAQDLRELLDLDDVRFERGGDRPLPPVALARTGDIEMHVRRVAFRMTRMPIDVSLPVTCGGREWGRFVLSPVSRLSVPRERRLVAVALADQVGAALATAHHRAP